MRRACEIVLNDEERSTLERWARGRSTPAQAKQAKLSVPRAFPSPAR